MLGLARNLFALMSVGALCACAPAVKQSADTGGESSVSTTETVAINAPETIENKRRFISKKGAFSRPATVKPGANITLKSELPKSMTAGSYQTVKLELKEGYQDGVMTVSIEPSDGLSLFGGSNSKTFNMMPSAPHIWDVDVKAETDGVYFLNVFAEANGQPRSFSVRVNVGAVTQKMFDDAMPADGALVEGGKIRALEATETIK